MRKRLKGMWQLREGGKKQESTSVKFLGRGRRNQRKLKMGGNLRRMGKKVRQGTFELVRK